MNSRWNEPERSPEQTERSTWDVLVVQGSQMGW